MNEKTFAFSWFQTPSEGGEKPRLPSRYGGVWNLKTLWKTGHGRRFTDRWLRGFIGKFLNDGLPIPELRFALQREVNIGAVTVMPNVLGGGGLTRWAVVEEQDVLLHALCVKDAGWLAEDGMKFCGFEFF